MMRLLLFFASITTPRSLRRLVFGVCFLSLYYTAYTQLETNIVDEALEQQQQHQQQQQLVNLKQQMTTTTMMEKKKIASTRTVLLSEYLGGASSSSASAWISATNRMTNTTLLSVVEASQGREPLLALLEEAGINITASKPSDIVQLPTWSSVTSLYYTNNTSNTNTSNSEETPRHNFAGPVIIGLEGCAEFRRQRQRQQQRRRRSYLGIAGTFNTGTTAFATLLQQNCDLPPYDAQHPSSKNEMHERENKKETTPSTTTSTDTGTGTGTLKKLLDKDITNVHGILSQVPWRKHKMAHYRDNDQLYYYRDSNSNSNNVDIDINIDIDIDVVLPIVLIRDPFYWMQSMCTESYGIRWDRRTNTKKTNTKQQYYCPKLVRHEQQQQENNSSLSSAALPAAVDTGNMVPVWMGRSRDVGPSWPSLIHYWNDWYESYLFRNNSKNNKNRNNTTTTATAWPRLIIRFEDTLFYPTQVVEQVCTCGGGTVLIKDNTTTTTTTTTIQYNLKESKPHHPNSQHTNFVTAMIKYGGGNANGNGNGNNTAIDRRIHNMLDEDIRFAMETINPKIMKMFHYTYPMY